MSPTRHSNRPPEWWKISLYDFIKDMPLEGWVWEFMRRARLKKLLKGRPVDAMNPTPDFEEVKGISPSYYKKWNDPEWLTRKPFYLPLAVSEKGEPVLYSEEFKIDAYETADYKWVKENEGSHYVTIRVDLNRRDRVIKGEFSNLLKRLRENDPEPKRIAPRGREWRHTLEVWDLREFKVSWSSINELLFQREDIQHARNTFKSAQEYIDKGGWQRLARYWEVS